MQQGDGHARLRALRPARARRRAADRAAARASAERGCERLIDRRSSVVRLSEAFEDGEALLAAARSSGSRASWRSGRTRRYRPGKRTRDWLKVKTRREPGVPDRRLHARRRARAARSFGALVLGVHRGDELVWAGNCGTGFTRGGDRPPAPAAAAARADDAPRSPACRRCRASAAATSSGSSPSWSARSSSSSGRATGRLRAPATRACATTSRPERGPPRAAARDGDPPRLAPLKLSNLDKVFWPDDGLTKGDLARLLPARRARARAASARPAVHDEALPRRHRGQALLPEGRAPATCRLDPDGALPATSRDGKRTQHDPLPARQRRARAAVDGEHGLHRHERLVLAGRPLRPPGLRAVRPRPGRGCRLPGMRRGRAAGQGAAGRRRPRELPEDQRLGRRARARADRAPVHATTTRAASSASSPARSSAPTRASSRRSGLKAKRRGVLDRREPESAPARRSRPSTRCARARARRCRRRSPGTS